MGAVTIDPDDTAQIERLRASLEGMSFSPWACGAATCLQAALRSLLAPPRPPEPMGLGAVVEDEAGTPWVRCENVDLEPHWYARNKQRTYDQLNVVRVLSEGVTS